MIRSSRAFGRTCWVPELLSTFERVARVAYRFATAQVAARREPDVLAQRNIHPAVIALVRELFDGGHFAQATFEAFKFVEKQVQRHTGLPDSGRKLMTRAFLGDNPVVRLTRMTSPSERDEQEGYGFLFVGATLAIRNPRGHEVAVDDDQQTCLDYLSLASLLLRRLERAGLRIKGPARRSAPRTSKA